ncbi:MAG: hypothetical protein KK482_26550, partial [Sinorhizobium meliloti]|nr:hypothetical protein [Sinorhizobium meliloti]
VTALLRLANRSSADTIEQRQISDCGQKQALGEGLSAKGIDEAPVTEDRIMYRPELQAVGRDLHHSAIVAEGLELLSGKFVIVPSAGLAAVLKLEASENE